MAYRITTTWNDGAVSTDVRANWATAQKVARRNRNIANVVKVTIDSASAAASRADGAQNAEARV